MRVKNISCYNRIKLLNLDVFSSIMIGIFAVGIDFVIDNYEWVFKIITNIWKNYNFLFK